jgi:hypothetical protein
MSASAELIDRAAMIEEINGSLNLFEVKRGKEKLSVFPLMVLRSGDELSVLKPEDTLLKKNQQTYIRLTFGGNQSEKVIYKKLPYLVKKRDTTPSIVENIAINTKTWFRSLYEHFYNTVETHTKGGIEVFLIPLLTEHEIQLLVAGKRVLHFAWQGGVGPYQVGVYQENLDKIVSHKKSDSKQVSFEGSWLPGYYQVIIHYHDEDSKKTIHGQFQVVTRSHPKLSGQDALNTTLQAAWLAQQENGVWRLEAYQQVFDFAEEKYQPALVLKKGLEAGK